MAGRVATGRINDVPALASRSVAEILGQAFWQLDPGDTSTMLLAVVVAVVGAALVEVAARINLRLEPAPATA